TLTMGLVTLGMTETIAQILNVPKLPVVLTLMAVVLIYAMVSGLWGVVMADLFQYLIASVGSIYLALASVHACGGLSGLREKLAAIPSYLWHDPHSLPNFNQGVGSLNMVALNMPTARVEGFVNG